ncbi:unnamed protein product [Dracunculus medinensis]|uniref:Nuclear receptor domain-containing protein n=1 Tax=Dracunculus medinensis TaxID=318479 RepID=A0A0N4UNN7_DRAME|nr:unnamed protein product [Dracunculus medinensis]
MENILENIGKFEKCSICGDVADGYHYGVLSCRGCNAFFRRAVTYGIKYCCRREGNCLVDKSFNYLNLFFGLSDLIFDYYAILIILGARCACRACRLKKCEMVGMDRRAVQPKRESGFKQSCSSFSSYKQTMPNYDINPVISLRNASFIECLVNDYNEQKIRRHMMLCSCIEEILTDNIEKILKKPAIGFDYLIIFKVQMVLMFEWVFKLEDFRSIESALDKAQLLRAFALRYLLLDNIFHTVELGYHDKIILVNNSYIVPGNPPELSDEKNQNRAIQTMMYGENSFRLITELIVPMIQMNLTAGEMMALRLIIFWNLNGLSLSSKTKSIAQSSSNRVVIELHKWYNEQKFEDTDTRFGNLLLFIPLLTVCLFALISFLFIFLFYIFVPGSLHLMLYYIRIFIN